MEISAQLDCNKNLTQMFEYVTLDLAKIRKKKKSEVENIELGIPGSSNPKITDQMKSGQPLTSSLGNHMLIVLKRYVTLEQRLEAIVDSYESYKEENRVSE